MKIVGLISGGKDSIFNLVCCKQLGFEITVLAHLIPSKDVLELDSYMYQSVGKELVPLISECLEIPIVQKSISGTAVNQEMDYKSTDGDEVEDLYQLLKTVLDIYPDVKGISCGAVMSSYQRNRVEEVAHRLNLTCYCFMWMLPEYRLLKSIVESNIKSVIVKVASFGLNEGYVGKSVSECLESFKYVQQHICKDFHCCGEGGEYETITLDGPGIMFKSKCISVKEHEIVCLDSNPYAPIYVLKPLKYSLVDKEEKSDSISSCLPFIDNNYCLEYYLLDTGRCFLFETGNKLVDTPNNNLAFGSIKYEFPNSFFDVSVFETTKTFMLSFTTVLSECDKLYDGVRDILFENVYSKEWFPRSNAIVFNVMVYLPETDNDADYISLLNDFWKNIGLNSLNVNWNPVISIGYVKCENEIKYKFIKYNIVIKKHSNSNAYKFVHHHSSSSISSYGTSVSKSFSNNISIMKCKDLLKLNSFDIEYQLKNHINPSIIISSCIYGIVPHLQLPPDEEQIKSFINNNEELIRNRNLDSTDLRLSIELSLALRSFRCDLNSLIYNTHLLSLDSKVTFRYDIFNLTHIWIIEISNTDVPLLEISKFFKSLIEMYKCNKHCYLSEWSSVHKYVENNSVEHIDPIIIPIISGECLSYNSKCKVTPISFFSCEHSSYHTIKDIKIDTIYWNFEARIINFENILFGLFSLDSNVTISQDNIRDILSELMLIINTIIADKFKTSLSECSIMLSKLFVIKKYLNIVNSEISKVGILNSSVTIPIRRLCNNSQIQYIIFLSE